MTRLCLILRRYGDEVEADLAFRGVDIRDHYAPRSGPSRLTTRRLLALVDNLPHDSAFVAQIGAEREAEAERVEKSKGSRIKAMQARHAMTEEAVTDD